MKSQLPWIVPLSVFLGCGGATSIDPNATDPSATGSPSSPPLATSAPTQPPGSWVPNSVPMMEPPASTTAEPPPPDPWPRIPAPACSGGVAVMSPRSIVADRLAQLVWAEKADSSLKARLDTLTPYTSGNVGCVARDMLKDPRAHAGVRRFYMGWLDVLRAPNESYVDPVFVPEFSPALVDSARVATERFVDHLFFEGEASFSALLLAPYAFSSPALDFIYGRSSPSGLTQQYFRGEDRQGIFTQAYFLMTRTTVNAGSPTQRGASVVLSLHCQRYPPAPPGVRGTLKVEPGWTTRQTYDAHYANPSCAGCHVFQGRPGYAFEHFDLLGRYRTQENGHQVDSQTLVPAVGSSLFSEGASATFEPVSGARAWMSYVASSVAGRQCHAAQWLAYARTFSTENPNYLNLATAPDRAAVEYVTGRAHVGDELDLRELVVAVTETSWFLGN